MGDGEHDQEVTPIAVDWVRGQAEVLLTEGSDVTIDATGACREDRASWIELARLHSAVPVAVVFRAPLQKALDGNRSRERHVPEDVIHAMWSDICQTTDSDLRSEGFAEVHSLGN
jgi:predicted kinase